MDKSTGHTGSMDTLPNTSTERHLGKHRAWLTKYHGGHTHAETNVTGQKHIEQVHRRLCHIGAGNACMLTDSEGTVTFSTSASRASQDMFRHTLSDPDTQEKATHTHILARLPTLKDTQAKEENIKL